MDSCEILAAAVAERAAATRYLTVRCTRHRADVEVCAAAGEIDLHTVVLLRDALREAEQRRTGRVLIDLSEVEFLAVAGVRVLVTAAQQARAAHRQLGLVVATRPVRRVLELTGALDLLVTYDCLADAVAALSAPDLPAGRLPAGDG
ncbi:STAS domain-containing protein [Amycolatopsis cihanbeyliensis]|nr:STAS domain-containing protein [Amycolatopsis cihanbeyliensis]